MTRFDTYSRYYDLLYREKPYPEEAAYVAARIREKNASAERIIELGCGTGKHAEQLARLGFSVHGVDLSETMLAQAGARQAALEPATAARLTFSHGDVRTHRSTGAFDAVISLFHVASYQTTEHDLDAYIATARAHLPRGGVFLFDFWYGPAVLTQKPSVNVKRLEDDAIRVTRVAEPGFRPNDNIVDVNYHVWIEEKSHGRIEQIRETHTMRYLFLPEVARLLAHHGFASWDAEEWVTRRTPGVDTWGVCVCAAC